MGTELSSRQRDFLGRLLHLCREAEGPVHYADVARALDVNPVTAYEMLRLLENKGLVRAETVRPQGRKSLHRRLFTYGTRHSPGRIEGDPASERDWEEAKATSYRPWKGQ